MDKTAKRLKRLAVFTFFLAPVFAWGSVIASDETAVFASLSRMIWYSGSSIRIFIAMAVMFIPMLISFFHVHYTGSPRGKQCKKTRNRFRFREGNSVSRPSVPRRQGLEAVQDGTDAPVQIGEILVQPHGVAAQDHAVAGGAHQLQNGVDLDLQQLVVPGLAAQDLIKHGGIVRLPLVDGPAEHAPAEILVDELQQHLVVPQLEEDIVHQGQDLARSARLGAVVRLLQGVEKELLRLADHQLFVQIVFVLEIEIEGALGHPGQLRDLGDAGLGQALAGEELKSGLHQPVQLLLFVFFHTSHLASPLRYLCSIVARGGELVKQKARKKPEKPALRQDFRREKGPAFRAQGAKMNAVHKDKPERFVHNAEKLTNGQKCLSRGLTNGHYCATLADDK